MEFIRISIGDGSYHFLNNVHFSNGNLSSEMAVFLVYRFETLNAEINIEAQQLYLKCREEHEKKIKKISKLYISSRDRI